MLSPSMRIIGGLLVAHNFGEQIMLYKICIIACIDAWILPLLLTLFLDIDVSDGTIQL